MENIKNNEIRIIVTGDVESNESTVRFEQGRDVFLQDLGEEATAFMLCATAGVMRDLQIPREVAMDFFELALDKAYEEAEEA